MILEAGKENPLGFELTSKAGARRDTSFHSSPWPEQVTVPRLCLKGQRNGILHNEVMEEIKGKEAK